jgi:hypothetical protein
MLNTYDEYADILDMNIKTQYSKRKNQREESTGGMTYGVARNPLLPRGRREREFFKGGRCFVSDAADIIKAAHGA